MGKLEPKILRLVYSRVFFLLNCVNPSGWIDMKLIFNTENFNINKILHSLEIKSSFLGYTIILEIYMDLSWKPSRIQEWVYGFLTSELLIKLKQTLSMSFNSKILTGKNGLEKNEQSLIQLKRKWWYLWFKWPSTFGAWILGSWRHVDPTVGL